MIVCQFNADRHDIFGKKRDYLEETVLELGRNVTLLERGRDGQLALERAVRALRELVRCTLVLRLGDVLDLAVD